jgi:hypothetical protein
MSPRLIPWSLAASGLLALLALFAWQVEPDGTGQRVEPQAAAAQPLAPARPPAAGQPSQSVPRILIVPPPPAALREVDPDVQPVPDDEPTVDDLPARRESP